MEGTPKLNAGVPARKLSPKMSKDQVTYLLSNESDISGQKNTPPTPIDFIGLPEGSTESDFMLWASRVLGVEARTLEGDGLNTEAEYVVINEAFQQGKDFLVSMLKYEPRQIPKDPASIKSKKDLINLLKKTVVSSEKKEGLNFSPFAYCRLVRAAIAAYETHKYEAGTLKDDTIAFENTMFSHEVGAPFVFIREEGGSKRFALMDDGNVSGSISSRGKAVPKAILRFVVRPESDAPTALKDGIASRITVETVDGAEKVLASLYKWLVLNKRVSVLRVENQKYFDENSWDRVKKNISKLNSEIKRTAQKNQSSADDARNINIDLSKITFSSSKANTTSGGDFQALKILGSMPVRSESGSVVERQFEIQIVLGGNKNEAGKMHHAVYDITRKVLARTRLDGGCPEHVFNEFIAEASKESKISESKIRAYLMGREEDPIVKIGTKDHKRGERSFISYSVYERWRDFGWVDQDFMEKLEHAARKK